MRKLYNILKTTVRPRKRIREFMIFVCLMWFSEHSFILLKRLLENIWPQLIILIYVFNLLGRSQWQKSPFLINKNHCGLINSSSSKESSQFWVFWSKAFECKCGYYFIWRFPLLCKMWEKDLESAVSPIQWYSVGCGNPKELIKLRM